MLIVRSLVKRFGNKTAVSGISFEVHQGETFGLLGPNGAGKSTTISMICGLLKPDEGEIWIKSINVREHPQAAKRVLGVAPQDIALYPTLSARENLNFWGSMYGLAGKELRTRVDEVLDVVSLRDRQTERIDSFSGGMKRRINIGASLLHRPELMIMDEPTVGIDPQSRINILETVKRLNRELGMTVIYTSHYMEEVEYLCRRLAIVDQGQIVAHGTMDEVRSIVGTDNVVRIKVKTLDTRLIATIAAVPGVNQVKQEDETAIALTAHPAEVLPTLLAAINMSGYQVTGIEVAEPTLETVFLHLTGRALRD